MKKLLFATAAVVMTVAASAQAQQFIGGARYNYGNTHGSYVGSSIRWTPQEAACYRANYASTLAMQRCTDQVLARLTTKRKTHR